jgi:drug/metabolite transporter (DMT)-like permease
LTDDEEILMGAYRPAGTGLALALVSAVTFGTSGTFARALIEAGWSPGAAVAARVGVGAVVLGVPAVLGLRGRRDAVRRSLPRITLFGLVAVAGAQLAYFNAVRYLPIGVALLLEYLGVVLVVAWMWAVHGQRPRRLTVAGAVAALAGLVFVLDLTGDSGHVRLVGVLWGLLAAVGLAAYFVLSARVEEGLPATAMAAGGMGAGALALAAAGAAGLVPMHATFGTVSFAGHRTSWLVPVAALSLVAAVVAYVAGIGAARILGARLSSFVGLTEVMFAVLVAWLLLGELPAPVQLLGGGLIVAGVALVRLGEQPPAAPPVPDDRLVAAGAGGRGQDATSR